MGDWKVKGRMEVGRRNNGEREGKVDLEIQKGRWIDRREEENDQGKEEEVKKEEGWTMVQEKGGRNGGNKKRK